MISWSDIIKSLESFRTFVMYQILSAKCPIVELDTGTSLDNLELKLSFAMFKNGLHCLI